MALTPRAGRVSVLRRLARGRRCPSGAPVGRGRADPGGRARPAADRHPQFVGLLLYRFDVNVRSSLVLGLVGEGAGHATGAGIVVGVLSGRQTAEELCAEHPTHVLDGVHQLPTLLS